LSGIQWVLKGFIDEGKKGSEEFHPSPEEKATR